MTLTQVQPLNIVTASKARDFPREADIPVTEVKPLQFLSNPCKWRCAAAVALVFFVASLALAPTLTRARDQKKLASEINAKTLKAAAAIQMSPRLPLHVKN
jgi:hypothetical protein